MTRDCETTRELLALLVLGALENALEDANGGGDRAACEAHLERCAPCRDESARLRHTARQLLLAAPAIDPPPGLWTRLERRIQDLTEQAPTGYALHLEGAREWVGAGDGVEMSQLWVDHERERHSLLIRMQPGAWLPAHRHAGPEECLVVRGDLDDGRVRLGAGDYIRFEAGTQHAVTTRGGCTLFVTASLCDSGVSQP